jgi:hypothetical protein
VANCFLGAFPPVDLRAVCFVVYFSIINFCLLGRAFKEKRIESSQRDISFCPIKKMDFRPINGCVILKIVQSQDRDEMSNLHTGHSIDVSCQVSVNLAKRFQRRFKKIGQSETRNACGGHV